MPIDTSRRALILELCASSRLDGCQDCQTQMDEGSAISAFVLATHAGCLMPRIVVPADDTSQSLRPPHRRAAALTSITWLKVDAPHSLDALPAVPPARPEPIDDEGWRRIVGEWRDPPTPVWPADPEHIFNVGRQMARKGCETARRQSCRAARDEEHA